MLTDFGHIGIHILVATAIVAVTLVVGKIIRRPDNPYPEKLMPYECGEEVIGSPWVKFNIRFYIFALLFLIFEVDVILIFPPIVVFREWVEAGGSRGLFAFVEIFIFLFILILALAYAWRKGDLAWIKTVEIEKKPEVNQS